MEEVKALAAAFPDGPAIGIGTPWLEDGVLTNAYAILKGGSVHALRHKVELPNYAVFDEKRVFKPGAMPGPVDIDGVRIGFPICEDIWIEDVCECLAETGAEFLVVPNGSPYTRAKQDIRMQVALARVVECELPLVYVNQVGGQDELVFDGASFVLARDRTLRAQLPAFQTFAQDVTMTRASGEWVPERGVIATLPPTDEADWSAAMLGLRDYVNKNRFPGVVIGLSGGIDSAICAALAVDALGAERVHCIMLPYRYTSNESLSDAADIAERLGVRYDTVPIAPAVEGFTEQLAPLFRGRDPDVTEENVQARIRGVILMAFSNKFGSLLVTTGNKSELAVGYCTLYGDMVGGLAAIGDVSKTGVYSLAKFVNDRAGKDIIPTRVFKKVPSAELRENQVDPFDYAKISPLVDEIIAKKAAGEPTEELETRIDAMVYELYGLSDEEIAIIEESLV